MKKMRMTFAIGAIALLAACGGNSTDSELTTDYGTSDLYTQEDMDAAIEQIRAEFDTWEGCELHSIRYAGDECMNEENLAWMNELKEGQSVEGAEYTWGY